MVAAKKRSQGATKLHFSAEIRGSSVFALYCDAPASVNENALEQVKEQLQDALKIEPIEGIWDLLLHDGEECEVEGYAYHDVANALKEIDGKLVSGLKCSWAPLPAWLVDAFPAFRGKDTGANLPSQFWMPDGLMPYQQTSIKRTLAQNGRILLADEMGLGKTAQALAAASQYLDKEGPMLVLVPPSLGAAWREEALRWLPQLSPTCVQISLTVHDVPSPGRKILIVSYPTFARKPEVFNRMACGNPWRMVICDEAHALRNPHSQRTSTVLPVLQSATRVILVTGTPTPKQASEAFILLHALRPLGCTYKEWCVRYNNQKSEERDAEVAALLNEVMVRRLKQDVLKELPNKVRQRIALQLPATTIACLARAEIEEEHFALLSEMKEVAAADYVEYVVEATAKKFLLFAHHISMLNALEKVLRKCKIDFIRIDGSTPIIERPALVNRFQNSSRCRVAVLSVRAAGEGLTLTAASLCIFCELYPAVPGVIEQAEARIHRLGQKASSVDIHYLVVEGTRDRKVFERLESRSHAVSRATSTDETLYNPVDNAGGEDFSMKVGAELDVIVKDDSSTTTTKQSMKTKNCFLGGPAPKKKQRRQKLEGFLDGVIDQAQADLAATIPGAEGKGPLRDAGGREDGAVPHVTMTEPITPTKAKAKAKREVSKAKSQTKAAVKAKAKAKNQATISISKPTGDSEEDDDDLMLRFFAGGL